MNPSGCLLAGVLCAVLGLSGCRNKEKEKRRAELTDLMHGNTTDPDIKLAIDRARATVPEFLSALQNPGPDRSHFMVRKAFPTADGKQQILWLTGLRYDGINLHGKLDDNTAKPGSGVPRDGSVSFPPSEIVDWMFNEKGLAVGGYMLRALKNKMTEEEWAGYASKITFKE